MSAGYMRRCAGKDRHASKIEAIRSRGALCASDHYKGSRKPDVYRCDQCLGWHVGGSGRKFTTRQRRSGKRPNKRLRGRV